MGSFRAKAPASLPPPRWPVAGAVLQIFLRAIRATLRRSSPTASSRAQLGAVSFFHRFGSSLNVHPHYHLVVLDGVFSKADDSEIAFHEAHDLTPDRIAQVESVVQKRVLRYFRRQGLLDEVDAAGMLTWQGSGGFFALRAQVPSAFSVDASVRIEAEDRAGIERLVRYCARPPFALERLRALGSTPSLASPESRLIYRFPKPDIHGRTELQLTPLELLDAIATNALRRCPRPAPARASTPLPRRPGSQCQAQAPRGGIRSARARVRAVSSRGRCRLTQPSRRARPRSGLAREGGTRAKRGSLGRPARSDLRRAAAALSRLWR